MSTPTRPHNPVQTVPFMTSRRRGSRPRSRGKLAMVPTLAIALSVGATQIQASAADVAEPDSVETLRPTPFVVAQHLVQLEGGRPLQWQVTPMQLGSDEIPLTATANLFVFSDDPLVLASANTALGSVIVAADEVVAVPVGSRWDLRAPTGSAATTVFGLGHQEGGTAPVGAPFTVGSSGWYQLEVRAHQLLPGETVEVGDDSSATLLIGRQGGVSVVPHASLFTPGNTLTTGRTIVGNQGDELAVFLSVGVTAVAAGVDLAEAGVVSTAASPAPTNPQTTTPPATDAPPATAAPTTPPTTDAPARVPTANDDSASSTGGSPISVNVMSNDDRGTPPAIVVQVDGGAHGVGQEYSVGNGSFRLNADGTATFSVPVSQPGATYTYSVSYVIENEHGSSSAVATFSIEG